MKQLKPNYYKPIIVFISFITCIHNLSAQQNKLSINQHALENKISIITVSYGLIACTCAQWMLNNNNSKHQEYIFLEPSNKRLIDAENIWDGQHVPLQLKLIGRFYIQKGFPQNYHPTKGNPEIARVFRYDKIQILSSYFRNKRHWGTPN